MEIVKYSYYVPSETKLSQLTEVGNHILNKFSKHIYEKTIHNGELVLCVQPEIIYELCVFLKADSKCMFEQLIDITAIDYPEKNKRFEIVYILLSLHHNLRIIIKSSIEEKNILESITEIYPNANWLEREVWDMFGLYFKNHPDLRRLLTDYGFYGHPLRKDFPVTGFVELSYDDIEEKIVYKPTKLMQDFRRFDKTNPWLEEEFKDAMQDVLSKDNLSKIEKN